MFLLRNDMITMISWLVHLFYSYLSNTTMEKIDNKIDKKEWWENFTHFMSRLEHIYQDFLTEKASTQIIIWKTKILDHKSVKKLFLKACIAPVLWLKIFFPGFAHRRDFWWCFPRNISTDEKVFQFNSFRDMARFCPLQELFFYYYGID